MVTSENQVRHFYGVKSILAKGSAVGDHLTKANAAGAVRAFLNAAGKAIFWEHVGPTGAVLRSDLIELNKIHWVHKTSAAKMQRKLAVKVIAPTAVTAGNDYYIMAKFRQFVGQTDSDTYAKYASAHAGTGATLKGVLAEIAVNMAKSLAPEASELLTVKLLTNKTSLAGAVDVTKSTNIKTLTGNYVAIALCEVEQPWVLGTMESVPVYFDIVGNESGYDANGKPLYEQWGTEDDLTNSLGTVVGNGKKVADLEYFLLGERGDQYRVVDPFGQKTEGLIDPTGTYDIVDIHYSYSECGTNNALSEKDITFAVPAGTDVADLLPEEIFATGVKFVVDGVAQSAVASSLGE